MKSGVWAHFNRGPGKKATCIDCGTAIDRPNSGTSGMLNHLEKMHPLRFDDAVNTRDAAKDRARKCAMVLAEHPGITASFFRSKSFLDFFSPTEQRLFPSRHSIVNSVIPGMVDEVIKGNIEKLRGVPVTIVTDGWSSKGNRVSLTCIIAYYLTSDWKQESALLAVRKTDGAHTGEVISDLLKKVIDEFNLDVETIVSDAASNVRRAVKLLGYRNPRCAAHGIHLVVRGGIAKWSGKGSLKSVKEFSELLSRSGPVRNTYFNNCTAFNLKRTTIPNSVDTRWNSDYFMLKAAIKQKEAINPTLAAHNKPEISMEEFATLEKMEILLGPIAAHMGTLTKEGVVLSEALLVWNSMMLTKLTKRMLTKFIAKETGPTKELAENILKEINSRWSKYFTDSDILTHCLFDPSVVKKFESEIDWNSVGLAMPVDKLPQPVVPQTLSNRGLSSRRASMYADSDDEDDSHTITASSNLKSELSDYLKKCNDNFGVNMEALDYWRTHNKLFPNLAILARRFLCAPPTSVSAERIFSCAGLLYRNHLRNRLGADKCEEYLLLRINSLKNLRALSGAEDTVIIHESEKVAEINEVYEKEEEEEEEGDSDPDREDDDEQDLIQLLPH